MRYIYLVTFFFSIIGFAQEDWDDFTAEEKAFLYHSARRTTILKSTVFNLFEFTDSIPYIRDTLPDYSYIEREVIKNPDKLIFHSEAVNRKSDGLLADLALRMALRELGRVLHYRNSVDKKHTDLKEKLKIFEKYVLEEVPQQVVRTLNNGEYVLVESLQGYYAPSLSVSDKMASLVNSGYSELDQMLILNAIMYAQEKYVATRTVEIAKALGVNLDESNDYLSAVGDGGNWVDLRGGIKTPYDKELSDEKGLFKFVIKDEKNEEDEGTVLKVKEIEQKQFTMNDKMETVVHVDVFGYHEERQTTIAIQSGGNSYVLYGKNEHRLVSPDSSYGEGTTYWRLMHTLEHVHIAGLKEDLYGKRGYEYQIDLYEKKIESTLMKIKKTEYRLDKLRHTPEGKPKIKKKKLKKKNLGLSDQAGKGHPTSALSKLDKQKNIEQNRLIQLNGQLEAQKQILEKLKEEMEKAYITLVAYEAKLDFMRKTMGYNIMGSEEENGVYYFSDGAIFDYRTQDFIFPPNRDRTTFQVYHISFGKDVFADQIDENFVHLNVSNRELGEKYVLRRDAKVEALDQMTASDSLQVLDVFNYLSEKKAEINFTVVAGGIREESPLSLVRDSTGSPVAFDAAKKRMSSFVKFNGERTSVLQLTLTSLEDRMIPADFSSKYATAYEKIHGKYPAINEIDFYSGIIAKYAANQYLQLLKDKANKWIKSAEKRSVVLGKLNKLKLKKVYFEASKLYHKVPNYIGIKG